MIILVIIYINNTQGKKMKNIIIIIATIIIVFYAGMGTQKFLMEDGCLDSGGSFNVDGICNIPNNHQGTPPK